MKRCLLIISAATLLFAGWQMMPALAQNDDVNADDLVESAALAQPDADISAQDLEAVESPSAQQPVASETPALLKPVEEMSTEPAQPESVADPAVKTELFDIDRQSQSAALTAEQAATPAAPAPRSFLGRMFDKDAKKQQVAPAIAEVPPAATETETTALSPEEILAQQEEVRREAQEVEGLKILSSAKEAMSRNEFDEALLLFNQALSVLPTRAHTVDIRNQARQDQAQCEYRIAVKYHQQGNLEEARKAINRALGYVPSHKSARRLGEQIARDESRKMMAKPPPIRLTPERLDKEKRIKEALSRGQQYMAIREYDKAAQEFNSVLFEDKGNEDATAHLRKIAEKGYQLETDQYEWVRKQMIAQVRDAWTPPLKPETAGPIKPPEGTEMIQPEKQRLQRKLNTIVIPQLDFRQANIVDVIKYLDQQSIIADTESPAGEKGVNIILNLKYPGQMETPAASIAVPDIDEEAWLGSAEISAASATPPAIPTVTLTLRNIVLLDAIKFITEVTGLKYRIESNVVVITPADVAMGEIVTRTYRVQPGFMGDISGAAMAAGGGITAELRPIGPISGEGGDVKRFFVDAGVPFPSGTSIKYQPSLNLLIVANTSENLEKFEQILSKLNVVPVQIEIEARFVEIGQTDLEELGLEWLLTDNWEIAQDASANASVPVSARKRIQIDQNNITKGLRNLDAASGGAIAGGNKASILSISSILTNPELSVILHALEQQSGANLLSAPKVTTKSGTTAEIKEVRELIYPTSFEQSTQTAGSQTSTTVNNQLTQIVVTPSGFQTRDTGVILNVTPTVGTDGFTIDLIMMPQVVELADWIDYGASVTDPGGVPRQISMPQPIFHSRSITTSISIWDGQTVVMGGLITEQHSTTVDKIPFLGDIPLIGYLFQSKTSNSIKKNLLIFVTANLVDPAGNKINKSPMEMAGTSRVNTP